MTPDLSTLTNAELTRYLSEHRNGQETFRAALEVLISRRNPANQQPYPFNLADPEREVKLLFREKLDRSEH